MLSLGFGGTRPKKEKCWVCLILLDFTILGLFFLESDPDIFKIWIRIQEEEKNFRIRIRTKRTGTETLL